MAEAPGVISLPFAGRYKVEHELGRGATAIVYLAHDLTQSRMVAIKMLRPELAESMSAKQFLAEIARVSRLEHPHIAPVIDSGEWERTLYCVLPYMDGGTLRDRIRDTKQMTMADALAITETLADALDYVHATGLIHRDVKPENILFADGKACLSDFGIARAIVRATGDSVTTMGMLRGTPGYMSPEQASGERDLDARSDVYSLACVTYEMIAGIPPFIGPTAQSIIAQHATHAPRPIQVYRPGVPGDIQRVLARAFDTTPADRYQSAGEFARALRSASLDVPSAVPERQNAWRLSRSRIAAAALLGLTVVAMRGLYDATGGSTEIAWSRGARAMLARLGVANRTLDTMTYAVIAPDPERGVSPPIDVAELARNQLKNWRELRVVEGSAIAPASGRGARDGAPDDRARHVAQALGAGRYVRMRMLRVGDSLDVSATLFDTRSDSQLVETHRRVGAALRDVDATMALFADALVLRGDVPKVSRPEGAARTRSVRARQAFLRGQVALEQGAFARADSEFFNATRFDPEYAQAFVWLANVRSWMNNRDRPWTQLTQQGAQAVAHRGGLSPPDSILLEALRFSATGRADRACPLWSQLATLDRYDYSAWYGLGNCLRRDSAVVRNAAGASEWRFRTSYEEALKAYETAFRLSPSILQGFGGDALADLQQLFFTSSTRNRRGRAIAPDSQQFRGIPVWNKDSLAFFPIALRQGRLPSAPEGVVEAIQRERERFLAVARMWRVESPRSAEAAEAVAIALEMLGNAAALDTLRVARGLANDTDSRLRMSANEVFVRVKFALPSDLSELRAAEAAADSLLRAHPPNDPRAAPLLAALAALTGKAQLAAAYASVASGETVPAAIAQSAPALLAFASLGGPSDTLRALERIVRSSLLGLPEPERGRESNRWLMRAASLAYPEYHFESLSDAPRTSVRASLVAAAAAADANRVRAILAQSAEARRWLRPADVTLDGVFPEAAALASIGDGSGAEAWLDASLKSLRLSSFREMGSVTRAGPLVRAMTLRADLAQRTGDAPTARLWANAVVVLWSHADAFLQPTVRRMERLAR